MGTQSRGIGYTSGGRLAGSCCNQLKREKFMRIGIATDHGGFELKQTLAERLRAAGHEIEDFGAHKMESGDDYPDFVIPLGRAVAAGKVERGIAVCGSGVGASVCACKIKGRSEER